MFKKIKNRLITFTEPSSPISEQFKKLRTRILYAKNGNRPRTILITSSVQGEGKSTVASNLAVSIAQGLHEHVLLIDCDLRFPSVHKIFDMDMDINPKGLIDFLKDDEDIGRLLVRTDIDKLSILPSGGNIDNPSELISSAKMHELINELKSRYSDRFIVIDSTPVISTTEPSVLSNIVDCIVFVVKAGKTPREIVDKALRGIEKEKIIGIVFNDTKKSIINKYEYYHYKS